MNRLQGKTALITGAARGIGATIAKAYIDEGANVAIADINLDAATKTAHDLGSCATAVYMDVCNKDSIDKAVQEVIKHFGGIDILINNAGTILRKPAAEHSDEYWDQVVDVNLRSQFILSRELGKTMLERGKGKIVFIASLLSFQGGITVPGYAASKGGIKSLTMALSNEWAGRGVNVNAVAPGYIATDNTSALQADPVRNKAILARIPAGRWGMPEDIAGTVIFLSSPASDYINGTTILVDGGWMGR